jgi:hypothetical protein
MQLRGAELIDQESCAGSRRRVGTGGLIVELPCKWHEDGRNAEVKQLVE